MTAVVFGQHVQGEDVGQAVVVDVGGVAAHRKVGGMANAFLNLINETPFFIVEVQEIGNGVIVGDVHVDPAIAIVIGHCRAQAVRKGRTEQASLLGNVLKKRLAIGAFIVSKQAHAVAGVVYFEDFGGGSLIQYG